ncbi:MAG: hypothetical protein VYB45_07615 [Pseudomonadota bacterium]|nr:hypothetical protein [Pseudomonadota bacterium]
MNARFPMTVFPVRQTAWLAAAAMGAATLLAAVSAGAQLKLQRSTPEIVRPEKPTPAPENLSGGITVAPRPLEESGIVVNWLDALDPDAIGLISEDQGGLPLGLWQGTDWETVRTLMPRMPAGTASTAIRDIARRLLVSRAAVPAGKPVDASLVALRVDRLLAMGAVGDAVALLKLAPAVRRDENLERTRIEALLFNNDNSGACLAVQNAGSKYTSFYWSQALAYCFALSGDHARASVIADLLGERATEVEPVFFAAIDALAGTTGGDLPPLKSPRALHLSMMRAARLKVPAGIVRDSAAANLRAVALSPNADLETRLVAADRAYRLGALSGDALVQLYVGIPFTGEELKAPISSAEAEWTPRTRALMLRSAAAQPVPLAKAEILRRAWEIGREWNGYAEIAATSLPAAQSIAPAQELSWFAGDIARVLFAGGEVERALTWYRIAASDRALSDEARVIENTLWPLALLADPDAAVGGGMARLAEWATALQAGDPENGPRRSQALFELLDGLGKPVPPEMWRRAIETPFTGSGAGLNTVWRRGLARAVEAGYIGEALLLLTVGAAESQGGRLSFGDAVVAVGALHRLGLEREARRLAVEAAVTAGI